MSVFDEIVDKTRRWGGTTRKPIPGIDAPLSATLFGTTALRWKLGDIPISERLAKQLAELTEATESAFEFTYCNHQGKVAPRRVLPISVSFGSSKWHPEPQWLMLAYDLDKKAKRSFAMKDMNGGFVAQRALDLAQDRFDQRARADEAEAELAKCRDTIIKIETRATSAEKKTMCGYSCDGLTVYAESRSEIDKVRTAFHCFDQTDMRIRLHKEQQDRAEKAEERVRQLETAFGLMGFSTYFAHLVKQLDEAPSL